VGGYNFAKHIDRTKGVTLMKLSLEERRFRRFLHASLKTTTDQNGDLQGVLSCQIDGDKGQSRAAAMMHVSLGKHSSFWPCDRCSTVPCRSLCSNGDETRATQD